MGFQQTIMKIPVPVIGTGIGALCGFIIGVLVNSIIKHKIGTPPHPPHQPQQDQDHVQSQNFEELQQSQQDQQQFQPQYSQYQQDQQQSQQYPQYSQHQQSQPQAQSQPQEQTYDPINLEHVPAIRDAVLFLKDYQKMFPLVCGTMIENADRLAGLVILVGAQKINTTYVAKAIRYRDNINKCIQELTKQLKQSCIIPQYFEDDIKNLVTVIDNHAHNIKMDVSAKLGKEQIIPPRKKKGFFSSSVQSV